MHKLRKYASVIAFLMAIWVVNFSVDPPDTLLNETLSNNPKQENLHFNEMESVYEWVVEKVLGFEHAVPEGQDNDHPVRHFRLVKVFCSSAPVIIEAIVEPKEVIHLEAPVKWWSVAERHYGWDREVLSPPPWN